MQEKLEKGCFLRIHFFSVKDEPFEAEQNETEENKPLLEVNQRFVDPLDQGNLLRGIDSCSVVARSVVQAQLKALKIT